MESLQSLKKGKNYGNNPSFAHERVACASSPQNAAVNTVRIIPIKVSPELIFHQKSYKYNRHKTKQSSLALR
jgi:hypothetical protein